MKDMLTRPARILLALRDAERDRPCSIARLRKLCDCRMSDLMRELTVLSQSGWVALDGGEDGGGHVRLAEPGRLLCAALAADSS